MEFNDIVRPVRKAYNSSELAMRWMDKVHSKWFKELPEAEQLLILDTLYYLEKQINHKY